MMKERFIELVNSCTNEKTKHKDFEKISGMKRATVKNLYDGNQRFNEEHIEVICSTFPEFKYWFVFGEEAPQLRQISPSTEKIPTTG